MKNIRIIGWDGPTGHVARGALEVERLLPFDNDAFVALVALLAAAAAASSSSSDPLWLPPERLDESLEWLHSGRW